MSTVLMNAFTSPVFWTILGAVAVLTLVVAVFLFIRKLKEIQRNSRLMGARLRDIGEVAVVEARCTVIHCTKKPRHFFTMELPLIREQCIFAVDVVVKVGFNFDAIRVRVDAHRCKIVMELPPMRILSSSVDFESLKLYDEKIGVFAQPKMEFIRDSMQNLIKEAETRVMGFSVFERAEESAKIRLEAFVGKLFDLTEYKLTIIAANGGIIETADMANSAECA